MLFLFFHWMCSDCFIFCWIHEVFTSHVCNICTLSNGIIIYLYKKKLKYDIIISLGTTVVMIVYMVVGFTTTYVIGAYRH